MSAIKNLTKMDKNSISIPKELINNSPKEENIWIFLLKILIITLGFILFKYFYGNYKKKEEEKENIKKYLKVGKNIIYNGIEATIDKIDENNIRLKISQDSCIYINKEFMMNNLHLLKIHD
ncbi:hypothetical protein AB836_00065 [Rickettsiales bacterium (ex Bugula neritina AB1)]|nr:hypothetical protein AB836_00065 [Rickettsiales bacterium (ex Bugula neritina AB1)]